MTVHAPQQGNDAAGVSLAGVYRLLKWFRSEDFRQAVRVALAMVITYGIALSMDWDKPFWAALSVAFCSLATVGDSINRGIQRVLGTLLAGVVALMLVALFPQDRWLFLLSMSAFIALCTYRMNNSPRFFFIWFAAGFTVPILAMVGGTVGANSFEIIILRAQQTTLGVVVYSLVAVLLWPRRGRGAIRGLRAHRLQRPAPALRTVSQVDGRHCG
jgi:uncharacterized membrane protein YccC